MLCTFKGCSLRLKTKILKKLAFIWSKEIYIPFKSTMYSCISYVYKYILITIFVNKNQVLWLLQYSNEQDHIILYVDFYNYDLKYSYLSNDSEWMCVQVWQWDSGSLNNFSLIWLPRDCAMCSSWEMIFQTILSTSCKTKQIFVTFGNTVVYFCRHTGVRDGSLKVKWGCYYLTSACLKYF